MSPLTRRQLIGAAAGLGVVGAPTVTPRGIEINPRTTWATDRPPKGPLPREDVGFLIVHHSASWNGHDGTETPAILRSFYDFHTSADKGWNDIAYNFLIDADGGVWEGREGSLDGPVVGDATGGNQGFSQLVCIIGDYNETEPTQASLSSLVTLLAWLADRYRIETRRGAEYTFISRGSNRHPSGEPVTTPTIIGHRTMSHTSCPGDNLHSYVVGGLMADVEAARHPPPTTTTTSAPASSTITIASTTTTVTASTTSSAPTTTLPVSVAGPNDGFGGPFAFLAGLGAGVVTIAAGLALWRHRRMSG